MSLKPDKNGNIEGFIKKEVHEKMKRNYMDTIENLQYKVDDLKDKMINLQENKEEFKRVYKEKHWKAYTKDPNISRRKNKNGDDLGEDN